MSTLREQWKQKLTFQFVICCVIGILLAWSIAMSQFNLKALLHSGPRFLEFFSRLINPNWSVGELIIHSMVETLLIAFVGTFFAVALSLPLGFLAASNLTPKWVYHPVKLFLGFLRSIPLIVVAIICVIAVGLGPFPGVLAIAFHSIGMLGKFYAEEFETANQGIINTVKGTGATWLQTIRFGLFPQCIPQVISFTLYRFEMNFRDATVLGLVGAGGIGYYIQLYVRSFQYDKVAVLLLVIIAVVTLIDLLTFWVRKRIA